MYVEIRRELIKHQDYLKAYAFKLTRNIEKSNELLQETNLKVLNNADKWSGSNFKAWVGTIMHSININTYIKESMVRTKLEYVPYYTDNVAYDANLDKKLECDYILSKLDTYNDFTKKCIMMYASGYKYDEISSKLNRNLNTVKSAIRTCRINIKKRI